ncbi:MAG: DUF447 family protein [Methanobacteriaceae archaeon]|nr:DUF447 family protein [Methanobacteriaceae archaeon]
MIFEEDIIYESVITTKNNNGTLNTSLIGVINNNNHIQLKLYSNKTLKNILKNKEFILGLTTDPLLLTRIVLKKLNITDYQKIKNNDCINMPLLLKLKMECYTQKEEIHIITAKIVETIQNKPEIPIINRATNKIVELLVDYTRLTNKEVYINKIDDNERIILKTGNKKHKIALELIKKSI